MAEAEIIEPLSQDEMAVLEIAAQGQAMIQMSAGRWTKPIASLRKRGFLDGPDQFNLFITEEGRKALEANEDAEWGEIEMLMGKIAEAEKVEQITHSDEDAEC